MSLDVAVRNRISGYVGSGVRTSLLRNSHMNNFKSNQEEFDETTVPDMLERLISVSPLSRWMISEVLRALVVGAKELRKEPSPLKQTTVDAILVDFINYCGVTAGCDFGLYTVDIEKP